MITKPIRFKKFSEDTDRARLERDCAAFVMTLLRSSQREPGMLEHLSLMSNRFTDEQFEIVEILGGELAILWQSMCEMRGLEPIEAFDNYYYPPLKTLPENPDVAEEDEDESI